ncbi:hypothetical protein ABIF91_006591 [Bradyrhizobium sp. USDA 241]
MTDDTIPPFSFPAVHAKKVTAAFDGGRLTSNGGVMLLAMAERRLGLANNLARVFPDRRIRRGSCTAWSICSALACSRSAAATRTPTTSII